MTIHIAKHLLETIEAESQNAADHVTAHVEGQLQTDFDPARGKGEDAFKEGLLKARALLLKRHSVASGDPRFRV